MTPSTPSTPSTRRILTAAAVLPLAGLLLVAGTGAAAAGTTAPPECGPSTIALAQSTMTAGGVGALTVRTTPNSTVDLFAYTRPSSTFKLVRTATVADDGLKVFGVWPLGNTRLYAQQRGCPSTPGTSVVLNVRPKLTLSAARTGTRSYSFSGGSLPARPEGLLVSLYRITPDGTQVLTGQTRANPANGRWRIDRRFSGTGRFGFVVRTSADITNVAGASNVQSVLIY